jgi:hypothetical protein
MIEKLKEFNFQASFIRNSIIQITWWMIFFPGFYSGDSFGAVQMSKSGELTNSFTASWALYVRLFSLHGHAIGLLTLINGLLLVFAVTRFAYVILSPKMAAISSFLLTLTPVVAGMGITLWHDILMTAGLLLVVSFMSKIQQGNPISRPEVFFELLLGAILVSFRPNGLPTLLVFSFLFLLFSHTKSSVKTLVSAIATTSVITFIGSNVILGLSPINDYYAQEWMRNDISCFANTPKGAGFVESNIPNIGNTQEWRSADACIFLNTAKVTVKQKIAAQEYIPSAWVELFKKDSAFVIKTHLQRNAYLYPIPIYGIPTVPFLHSTIEFKDSGIEWAFPKVAEAARAPMRVWNALRGITGWAGLWALITFGILMRSKNRDLLAALLMSISLLGVLFIFAPIPDGRYALYALIVGQLAFIGKFVEWAQTGSNRRPTD